MITCHQADSQFIENPQVAICNHVWKRCEKNTKIATGNQDIHTHARRSSFDTHVSFLGGLPSKIQLIPLLQKEKNVISFNFQGLFTFSPFNPSSGLNFFGYNVLQENCLKFRLWNGKTSQQKVSCSISQRLSLHYNLYLFTQELRSPFFSLLLFLFIYCPGIE